MRFCARTCCATAKDGFPKRAWTILPGSTSARVWVVDPLDGTREFVQGIPEFCVSIGFIENGRPVAGGIYNPATEETFLGARSIVECSTTASPHSQAREQDLKGALMLASRSEVNAASGSSS